jgi:hypothetical protein
MFDEERDLANKINEILESSISSDRSIFYRALSNYKYEKSKINKKYSLFKIIAPVALAILIATSSIFPVFGSNGSLVDIYNSYRVNKEISCLHTAFCDNGKNNNEQNSELMNVGINSFIEKEFNIDPLTINKLYIQGIDERDLITIVLLSKIINRNPIDVVEIRKRGEGWGIILRKNQINPSKIIIGLRAAKNKINQKTTKLILRGSIEAFSEGNQTLMLENYPYKIYISNNTLIESSLILGKHYEIEADYQSSDNVFQAVKIKELNLMKIGIRWILAQIISIDGDSLSIRLKDGSLKQVFLNPRTRVFPTTRMIFPGNIVRMELLTDGNQIYALTIKGIPSQIANPLFKGVK